MDPRAPNQQHWTGGPLTRPRCPQHGTIEKARIIERGGERFIEFACPVAGCPHNWIVKKIRL